MSKHAFALMIAGIVALGFVIFTYNRTHAPERIEVENGTVPDPAIDEQVSAEEFEEYVREHISTLSPEPAVLGGTFYVTDVVAVGEGKAVVSYEDGHIALVADVSYIAGAEGGVQVNRFEVREDVFDGRDSPPTTGSGCVDVCGNGVCEEVVCMAVGCPCAETPASCPQDCRP